MKLGLGAVKQKFMKMMWFAISTKALNAAYVKSKLQAHAHILGSLFAALRYVITATELMIIQKVGVILVLVDIRINEKIKENDMSRLQVGGLALVIKGTKSDINVGLTVELIHYDDWSGEWLAQNNDGILLRNGKIDNQAWFAADRLLPLGDKQTQDELAKERELENV